MPNITPSRLQLQPPNKIRLLAVPIKHKESDIKLISINQYRNIPTNGYKQFDITIENETHKASKEDSPAAKTKWSLCLQELRNNVINLNNITALSLQNCDLHTIPSEIGLLPLKELDLMHNSLKFVPECLYLGLKDIEVLNLSHNPLRAFNIMPKCAEKLKILHLSGCSLENLPVWIQEMKTKLLEELHFSDNEQTSLRRLDSPQITAKIKKLVFNNAGLRQKMLGFFKTFQILQFLDFSNIENEEDSKRRLSNSFSDINELVMEVSWFRHIRVLKLNNLQITELSDAIYELVNLEELHLKQNLLLSISEDVNRFAKLKIFDISYNCVYSLADLTGLEMLEELHAAKNHLGTVSVRNAPRLRYLDLYDNDLESLEFSSAAIECIDVEQNYLAAEMLLDAHDNYAGHRECLRSRGAGVGARTMFGWRAIGRKLGVFELESPAGTDPMGRSESDEEDCHSDARYTDNEDEGRGQHDEDEGWGSRDDCSDWDEATENLVTLSDAEFSPEDAATVSTIRSEHSSPANSDESGVDLEHLFIDAD